MQNALIIPQLSKLCKGMNHVQVGGGRCQCGFLPRPAYKLCRVEDSDCDACE